MTLDEAIEHAEFMGKNIKCEECAREHFQLAEWLKELKEYKNKQMKTTAQYIHERSCKITETLKKRKQFENVSEFELESIIQGIMTDIHDYMINRIIESTEIRWNDVKKEEQ